MRPTFQVLAFVVLALATFHATPISTEARDKAIVEVQACLQRKDGSGRVCKKVGKNVDTLVEVYRGGDKSVLPILLRFPYLNDFFGEALLGDPEGFLGAASRLSSEEQKRVAEGLAGQIRRISKVQFEAITKTLTAIPESAPVAAVAQLCLAEVRRANAQYFVDYFPPETFSSYSVYGYSRAMYTLGQQPIWPVPSGATTTYRLMVDGGFRMDVITLNVLPDGTGRISMKVAKEEDDYKTEDHDSVPLNREQIANFLVGLRYANFWSLPPSLSSERGVDGADWILEGVDKGQYHVVARWCPGIQSSSVEERVFGETVWMLFELAGHKRSGSC